MDREKFWGALVGAMDREKYSPSVVGRIVTITMIALDYATEAEG